MNFKVRWINPNQVYELTVRSVDRQFVFKPNHHSQNPLLAEHCPLNALDMDNDVIPEPSIINVIGAAVGRALEKYPVQIHCFESNISHLHEVLSVTEDQRANLPGFLRSVHSLIARGVNRIWEREGHLFGARSRIHPCLDDGASEKHLLYAVTNAVKDHLVERVSQSPFFSTFEHLAKGGKLRFWYIDHEAYWAAGGNRKKGHRLKAYLKWVEWECAPLPQQEEMSEHQRQSWMRHQVRDIERECKRERREAGTTVIGQEGLHAVDPRDRPKAPKQSGQEPLCHASDPELKKEYKKSWRTFMDQFIEASADYRSGHFEREFPDGSYRPPLVTIYSASKL